MGGGDAVPTTHGHKAAREVNVFITGFGPFPNGNNGYFYKNASHLITKVIPTALPAHTSANPTSAHINIHNPTSGDGEYVATEYAYIRRYVKKLHEEQGSKIDLFVHLGQAFGIKEIWVERYAYKQGFSSTWWQGKGEEEYYLEPDNKGKTVRDAGENPWGREVPMGLDTAFDVDVVVEGANRTLRLQDEGRKSRDDEKTSLEVIAHHEGGYYGCGFIFYESMANCYVLGRKRDVLFCHVPGETDDESVKKGGDAIVAIIGAAVGEFLSRK